MNKLTAGQSLIPLLLTVSLFSIAMGFLESAVVIYLREILYPHGFTFPLSPMSPGLITTEVLREAATLVMLIGIGILAGRNSATRFAWFLYSFAIWDIFYYVFLKLLIGWPESIMTWDVLFLIPLTWTGPVLSPLILTVIMIVFTLVIVNADRQGVPVRLLKGEWALLISGSLISIIAFIGDYGLYLIGEIKHQHISGDGLWESLKLISSAYIPQHFPWLPFILGVAVISSGVGIYSLRIKKMKTDI